MLLRPPFGLNGTRDRKSRSLRTQSPQSLNGFYLLCPVSFNCYVSLESCSPLSSNYEILTSFFEKKNQVLHETKRNLRSSNLLQKLRHSLKQTDHLQNQTRMMITSTTTVWPSQGTKLAIKPVQSSPRRPAAFLQISSCSRSRSPASPVPLSQPSTRLSESGKNTSLKG